MTFQTTTSSRHLCPFNTWSTRNMCAMGLAHTGVIISCGTSLFQELVTNAARSRGKLIVWLGCLRQCNKPCCLECSQVCKLFLFVFFVDFFYLQMVFLYICRDWAQRLLAGRTRLWKSLNPNTWIPVHLFGYCPSLSVPLQIPLVSPCQVWSHCRRKGARQWMVCFLPSPG